MAGDLSGQGYAHLFASLACSIRGERAEAVTQSGQALALFRQTADPAGQGWALAGLGECHARLGNYELARGYARQALEAGPATGDPTTLAFAWDALAFVHARLGEHREAISCYQKALALVRERKNPTARGLLVRLLAESGDARRGPARRRRGLAAGPAGPPRAGMARRDGGWRQARAGRTAQPAGLMVRLPSRRSAAGAADSRPSHRGRRHSVCGTPIARQPGGFR